MAHRPMVGVFLLLLTFVAARGVDVSAQEPSPEWTLRLNAEGDDTVIAATWAPTNACFAVATDTTISVVSAAGELLWRWNFRQTSRWLTVRSYLRHSLAVSPACDHAALAGDSGYRVVWAADRTGKSAFVQTVGTPLALAFDLKGEHLAIATGAGRGYLLTPSLEPRWTGRLDKLPVRWPAQVVSGNDRNAIEFTQGAVNALLGVPPWGYRTSDSVSDDGQWRVVTGSPWARADLWQMLEFYGPESRGYHGRWAPSKARWSKPMGCLDAGITPDGEFIVATGDLRHPDHNVWEIACFTSGSLATYVFDRTGVVVATQPLSVDQIDVDRLALAEAVLRKTGKSLMPLEAQVWTSPCDSGAPICLPSSDGRLLVTNRDDEIRMYRVR